MKKQQPTPKKVTVGRLKQVSDSLKTQEAKKSIGGYALMTDKKSTQSQKDLGHQAMRSALADRDRYSRYDSLIKKATSTKPVMKIKKTVTKLKKK